MSTADVDRPRWFTAARDTEPVHPRLSAVAARRLGVFTSHEAMSVGYRVEDIRAELRTRRWARLRKGVYIATDRLGTADARERHLIDCVAVLLVLGPGPVLSHGSAAQVHGLTLPRGHVSEVRLSDEHQWRRGRGYRVAQAAMTVDESEPWLEFRTTSIPRSLVDCAREWSLTDAVVALDAALHEKKASRADLLRAVLGGTHRPGIAQAARALDLADGRAESPLETRGRLAMLSAGLPRAELQVEIHGQSGLLGRVDAWYDDAALAIEFDGQVKYTDPRYASSPGQVLWEEKRREDGMRALGIPFVRVVNQDLGSPWPRVSARIHGLLTTPFIGPRLFRAVRTDEPGASDAA